MENEPEVIRQQMEDTRASLTEKLETLENQVVQTVQDATSAVTDTVASVKEAVQDTVGTVKDSVADTVESVKTTLDVRLQTERHPWLMVGGSVAVGYLAGRLLSRRERSGSAWSGMNWSGMNYASRAYSAPQTNGGHRESVFPTPQPQREEESWLSGLGQTFGPEIDKIKGLAIGTVLGLLRDSITRSVPEQLAPRVAEVVDSITTKLGAQPIRGPLTSGTHEDYLASRH